MELNTGGAQIRGGADADIVARNDYSCLAIYILYICVHCIFFRPIWVYADSVALGQKLFCIERSAVASSSSLHSHLWGWNQWEVATVNSVDWTIQNQSSDLFSLVGFHVKVMYCASVFFNLQRGFNTGRSRVWTAVVRVDCFPGFRWSTFTVSSSHIIDNADKVGSDLLVLQHHSFMCWLHISAYILPCLQIYAAYMLTHGHDGISANTKLTTVTAPKSSPLIPHHQLDAKLQQPVMGGRHQRSLKHFCNLRLDVPFYSNWGVTSTVTTGHTTEDSGKKLLFWFITANIF